MALKLWQHHAKAVISHTNLTRTMSIIRFLMIFVAMSIASSISFVGAIELRQGPVHVKMSKKLYLEKCASCHGVDLVEQKDWQDTTVDK